MFVASGTAEETLTGTCATQEKGSGDEPWVTFGRNLRVRAKMEGETTMATSRALQMAVDEGRKGRR